MYVLCLYTVHVTNSVNKKHHYYFKFYMLLPVWNENMLHLYIFKKKDLQQNLLAYIQCFFSDMQNVISLGCCQHPFVGLLESM